MRSASFLEVDLYILSPVSDVQGICFGILVSLPKQICLAGNVVPAPLVAFPSVSTFWLDVAFIRVADL